MKKLFCVLLVLALAFSLAACNKAGEEANSGSTGGNTGQSGSSAPVEITVALTELPNSLDPISDDYPDTLTVCYHIYDRLVNFDEDNNILPGMSKSWKKLDDKTWQFDVDIANYKFQNGDPLTMDDIVYSFLRVRDIPKQADAAALIDSATYEGNTLTLKFTIVDNSLLQRMLNACIIVDKAYIEANGEDAIHLNPIGTGPYKLLEFTPGTTCVIGTWDGYPSAKPQIEKISFLGIGEDAARYIAVETGQAQLAVGVSIYEQELAEENSETSAYVKESATTEGFVFNCSRPPFDNVNVRIAVAHAIDRAGCCALQEGRNPQSSYLFCGYSEWYYESPYMPDYDLQLAKEMLAAEGFNESNPMNIELVTYSYSENSIELLQSILKTIGVELKLSRVEFGTYLDAEYNGTFDMLWCGLMNRGGHPFMDLDRFDVNMIGTRNISRYVNPAAMDLVTKIRAGTDTQELKADITELNDIIAREVPMFAVYQWAERCVYSNNLSGFMANVDMAYSFRNATYNG